MLVKTDAWLDKLVGDEVIGLYLPGFAGPEHAKSGVRAARELLHVTGHGDPNGPWIPVGAGVHTGVAYVGLVGTEGGISDMTALGDAMNTTARLASQAKAGEILVSEPAYAAAGLDLGDSGTAPSGIKGTKRAGDCSCAESGSGLALRAPQRGIEQVSKT